MEATGLNRPPIAAPVSTINVNALPVVRSQGEVVEDLLAGLIPGLMTNGRGVEGIAFLAVRDDHVVVRRDFGAPRSEMPFEAGTMGDLFASVAMMQQIEQAKIRITEKITGVTLEQALTHQPGTGVGILETEIARIAGQPYPGYLAQAVFAPLNMSQSTLDGAGLHTSVADMGQLMIALLNGGAAGEGRILEPATVEAMERTHVVLHPAVPGFAYGFAEMRRNGWRALQHDGEADGVQTRLVLVPEARFGYFVLLRGRAGAAFWRTFDNTLFDRVFVSHGDSGLGSGGGPPPDADAARAAQGVYGASADTVAPLKTAGTRLTVEARENGALALSGIENAVLTPRDGGYWATDNGSLNAVYRDGKLLLSSGSYEPLALWLRWDIYLLLALAVGFAASGAFAFEHRSQRAAHVPGNLVLAGGAASAAFGLAALLIWLLAPA